MALRAVGEADEHVLGLEPVAPAVAAHGVDEQGVADDHPARLGRPGRLDHVRAGLVAARHRDPLVGGEAQRPGGPVEQRPEDARRVEPRQAQPLDRAVGGEQGPGLAVGEEPVGADPREVLARKPRAARNDPGRSRSPTLSAAEVGSAALEQRLDPLALRSSVASASANSSALPLEAVGEPPRRRRRPGSAASRSGAPAAAARRSARRASTARSSTSRSAHDDVREAPAREACLPLIRRPVRTSSIARCLPSTPGQSLGRAAGRGSGRR